LKVFMHNAPLFYKKPPARKNFAPAARAHTQDRPGFLPSVSYIWWQGKPFDKSDEKRGKISSIFSFTSRFPLCIINVLLILQGKGSPAVQRQTGAREDHAWNSTVS